MELFELLRTRDNDTTCAERRNRDLLTLADAISVAISFAGHRTAANPRWRSGRSMLVPEELGIHALINCGFKGAPETVSFDENFVESIASDGLADIIVRIHHADLKGSEEGSGLRSCLIRPEIVRLMLT